MTSTRTMSSRAVAAVAGIALAMGVTPSAIPTAVAASDPTISVIVRSGTIQFHDWAPGTVIDVTIDGAPFGPYSFEDCQEGCDGLPVGVGSRVEASDGSTTKTLDVDDVIVTVVEERLEVTGTSSGPDGAMVHVNFGAAWRDVPVSGGTWVAAFGVAPEPDAGDGTLTTFGGTMSLMASVLDGDDDATSVHLASPSIHVSPWNDFMWGNDFAPGDPVSVTVDGHEIGTPTPDEWGYFELDMPFDPETTIAALQHGWIADVSVADLLIVAVNDPDPGIVSGAAPDGALVDVHAWGEHGWASRVTTASGGAFTVDFSVPGGPQSWGPDPLDLIPGTQVRAHIYDDRDLPDHDATYNDTCVEYCPGPGGEPELRQLEVFPDIDMVLAWWSDAGFWLTIDRPGELDPVFVGHQPGPAYGFDLWALDPPFDVRRGDTVTMTDGETEAVHTVVDITVDPIEEGATRATGTGPAGRELVINLLMVPETDGVGLESQWVTVDELGDWTADFSSPFGPGLAVEAVAFDEGGPDDNDQTHVFDYIPNPFITVVLNQGFVQGEGWPAGETVTISVDDPGTPEAPDDTIDPAPVVESQGGFPWDTFWATGGGWDLQHGDTVTATIPDHDGDGDPDLRRVHTVIYLTLEAENIETGFFDGYTQPGERVVFAAGNESEHAQRHVTARPVTDTDPGYWSVDLSTFGPADEGFGTMEVPLAAGTAYAAEVFDDDGDVTNVGNCHECDGPGGEPRIQAFLNDEAFTGEHFTPDAEVLVTLYEFDGGVPLIGPDEPFGTNDEGHFEGRDLLEQGLQPGMVLEVRDEQLGVTKRLEFVDIRFHSFDPDTNVVAGSVFDRPSDDIFVQLADQDYEPIVDEFGNPIRVNVDGTSWWLDLDDVGYDPDGLTEARVEVGVGDGETLARLPQVIVTVPHTVQSADFDSDVTSGVTVELIDHTPDGTVVTIDDVDVNLRGEFAVPTEEYGVDLDPGDEITVTGNDTGVVKHHIVFELTIDEVDFENDTIRGTAAPGVWISVGGEFVHERVWSGEGDWTVTFETGIEEGMLFGASIGDPDLDFTVVETTPPAFISAEPFREIVRAEFFPVGNQLELIVSDDGATVLGPLTATVEGERLEWFLLPDGFDLEPGHLVTVTDLTASETELFRRELIVADIGVTEVDDVADVVRGTVSTPDPYPGVFVAAGTESAGGERFIDNDGTGIWEAGFGGEVDIDKTQGWNLFIRVPDADGEPADATIFAMPEASPGLLVEPYLDVITTEGSGLGDLTIRIPELGYEFTATPEHPAGPADIFPGVEFDPFALAGSEVFTYGIGVDLAGQIDLVPGMLVQASDVLWEMEMTVTDFVVDEVDSANDTVAGLNPLPETPEGPGLVGTFTSGPTAFGFEFPETERWELTMTAILDGGPGGPYDIDGTEVGISFGTPTEDQPYDTYTAMLWDLRPHITSLLLPVDPVEVGTAVDLDATFTDLDVADTHTVRIDWGDGTETIVVESDPVVDQVHVYTEPGIHTVELTVTDAFDQTDTATHQFVVVYDPSAGFVTGGGWIDSPAGAYTADPDLTGTANFGFVAKYLRGRTTPDGNATFQFQTADLQFHSTDYEWLVITGGDHAKFKGSGTINGLGDYGFMITAVDDPDGDTFRIKIWDRVTDETVYDNHPGAGDDAYDTTLLGGGSITVHTGR